MYPTATSRSCCNALDAGTMMLAQEVFDREQGTKDPGVGDWQSSAPHRI